MSTPRDLTHSPRSAKAQLITTPTPNGTTSSLKTQDTGSTMDRKQSQSISKKTRSKPSLPSLHGPDLVSLVTLVLLSLDLKEMWRLFTLMVLRVTNGHTSNSRLRPLEKHTKDQETRSLQLPWLPLPRDTLLSGLIARTTTSTTRRMLCNSLKMRPTHRESSMSPCVV